MSIFGRQHLINFLNREEELRRVNDQTWVDEILCEFCDEIHLIKAVHLTQRSDTRVPPEIPLINPIWLSDGTNDMAISFGPHCMNRPFNSFVREVVKKLGLAPIGRYQLFESVAHLFNSISFSIQGYFYEWEGPEPDTNEDWAIAQGYLKKTHYQRQPEAPILDVLFEVSELAEFESSQFGLSIERFGLRVTVMGEVLSEMDQVICEIEKAIDGYLLILGPVGWEAVEN